MMLLYFSILLDFTGNRKNSAFAAVLPVASDGTRLCQMRNGFSYLVGKFPIITDKLGFVLCEQVFVFGIRKKLCQRNAHGGAHGFKVDDRGHDSARKGVCKRALVQPRKLRQTVNTHVPLQPHLIEFFNNIHN